MNERKMEVPMAESLLPSDKLLWKPNKWIAVVLSLFTSPLGLIYAGRPRVALAYLLFGMAGVFTGVYVFHLDALTNVKSAVDWLALGVVAVMTVHSYVIAVRADGAIERKWFTRWWGLIAIYVAFIPLLAIRAFLFEPFRFPSESMYPTIPAGSHFLITKAGFGNYKLYGVSVLHAARTEKLSRGDIVVFSLPDKKSVSYAKRIIGLPGDVLTYQNKRLFINGLEIALKIERVDEKYEYGTETIDGRSYRIVHIPQVSGLDFELTVPDGQVFVMGDNRDNSKDSRHWGPIPDLQIVGRAMGLD
jgi:signal peptidase I